MKTLATIVGVLIVVALLPVAAMAVSSDTGTHPVFAIIVATALMAVVLVGLRVWSLTKRENAPDRIASLLGATFTFVVFAATMVLIGLESTGANMFGLALVLTAVLVTLSYYQERYFRSLRVQRQQAGRDSFDSAAIASVRWGPAFRWTHRVLAFSWVWSLYTLLARPDVDEPVGMVPALLIVAPGFVCFMLVPGRVGGVFVVVAPFLGVIALVSAAIGSTWVPLVWVAVNFVWAVTIVFKTPTDRRYNSTRAHRGYERTAPW